jgi:hypothetical protein
MSAERLAIGDLIRCHKCRRWHPTEQPASGSATDYATQMLFYRCGDALFYAGQISGTAREPKNVRSPLVVEAWRLVLDRRVMACEIRQDASGWDVMLRGDGEPIFSRRCDDENHAQFVATGLMKDHRRAGWTDAGEGERGER